MKYGHEEGLMVGRDLDQVFVSPTPQKKIPSSAKAFLKKTGMFDFLISGILIGSRCGIGPNHLFVSVLRAFRSY
jgi:hypothetical protein